MGVGKRTIYSECDGWAAKDWSNVAKKGQVFVMELELKKLYETVTSIHDNIIFMKENQKCRSSIEH